jgi:hypothetical protein
MGSADASALPINSFTAVLAVNACQYTACARLLHEPCAIELGSSPCMKSAGSAQFPRTNTSKWFFRAKATSANCCQSTVCVYGGSESVTQLWLAALHSAPFSALPEPPTAPPAHHSQHAPSTNRGWRTVPLTAAPVPEDERTAVALREFHPSRPSISPPRRHAGTVCISRVTRTQNPS